MDTLGRGPSTVSELASGHRVGLAAISKHLTVLERAGLIRRERHAQWRRCHLDRRGFDVLHSGASHYEALWAGGLDRLDDYLHELGAREPE